jgi:hypothetical protein
VPVHLEVRRPSGKSDASAVLKRTDTPPPLLVGAMAGTVARLLLILPMEVGAGLWLAPTTYMEPAELKSHFLRHFVLLTWWVGAVAGAALLYRHGRRTTDLVYGLIAGGVAGLVGSATLGCVVPELDWLPRLVWHRTVAEMTWSSAMPVWAALAVVSWACWGGLAGLVLGRAGPTGIRFLRRVANGLARLFRLCGLKRTAARFQAP